MNDDEETAGSVIITHEYTDPPAESSGRAEAVALLRESEQRFRAVFDDAPIGMARISLGGRFLESNRALQRMFGHSAAEARTLSLDALTHPHDVATTHTLMAEVMTGQRDQFAIEQRYLHRDGRLLWGRLTTSVVHDSTGAPLFLISMIEDITARKQAEEDQRLLAEASTVLGSSLDISVTLERLTALLTPRLADWCFIDVLHQDGSLRRRATAAADPELRALFAGAIAAPIDPVSRHPIAVAARSGRTVFLGNLTGTDMHGMERDGVGPATLAQIGLVSGIAAPLVAGGKTVGVLSLVMAQSGRRHTPDDITLAEDLARRTALALENARLYEAEQRARRAAEEATAEVQRTYEHMAESERLRGLGVMASGIAHDFNNLLGVILGRCDVLRGLAPGGKGRRRDSDPHLDVIRQAALDGAETVRRLQVISGVRRVTPAEAMDPATVLHDVAEFTRPRWKDAVQQWGLAIQMEIVAEGLPLVQGNPAELREVLVNLVFNAVDAMPHGGGIRLGAARVGDTLHFSVCDTGVGMTEDVRRRVFEPFFSTRGQQSAGLGLSICRGLIASMGGEIVVESAPNQGAAFTIVLPFRPVDATVSGYGSLPGQALRILLVDDEPQVRSTMALLLGQDGHQVSTAASAIEALALFGDAVAHPFDLVLTDLGMPGMNGLQLIDALRRAGATLPCLVATGWGSQLNEEDVLAGGAQGLLAKPFSAAQLRNAITACF